MTNFLKKSKESFLPGDKKGFLPENPITTLGTTALVVGVGVAATNEHAREAADHLSLELAPNVSSSGTEALIALNDTMLNYGTPALSTGLAALAAYTIAKRRNPEGKLQAMHDITHQTSHKKSILYVGATAGIIASAVGLGDSAGKGASEPVNAMSQMLGADKYDTPIVTSYDNTPYNYSGIDYSAAKVVIESEGGTAVPFIQALGEVKNPDSKSNPSSAPIFAVPNDVLKASLGVSMPEVVDCGDMSVIVGKQLGAQPGDKVTINDKPATVAGVVDIKPGLDRVAAIGSLEQITKCVYPDMPMTGAVALGLEGQKEELQAKLHEALKLSYSARSFEEFEKEYTDFWDKSVKPPEMLLIAFSLALGSLAIAGNQVNDTLSRRKNIAMLMSQGVDKKRISRAYGISAYRDSALAIAPATALAGTLIAVNNSSQFGLEEAFNPSVVGAGYLAGLIATTASVIINNKIIKNIDVAAELRSTT